ncbi:sigma-70 family RNA polymerase sigma factor [Bacillaceae bacterium S4-13-58]
MNHGSIWDEIKRFVYTYVKNHADTDDVTQEVFVTVYQKLHTYKGISSLRSWIYSIASNKSKDYLRSWKGRNQRLKEKLYNSQEPMIDNRSPEDISSRKSESSELLNHVLQLPLKYRELIILYYFKDFSIKEISDLLGEKEATIRTRLARGRQRLKFGIERGEQDGR